MCRHALSTEDCYRTGDLIAECEQIYSNSYLTVSASSVVHHVFACEGHKISAVSCDGTFALWLVS